MCNKDKQNYIKCSPEIRKIVKDIYNDKDFLDDLANSLETLTNEYLDKLIKDKHPTSSEKKKQFKNVEKACFMDCIKTKSFEGKSENERELLFIKIFNEYKHQLETFLESIKVSNTYITKSSNIKADLNVLSEEEIDQYIKREPVNMFSQRSITNILNPNYFRNQINQDSFRILADDKILNAIMVCKFFIGTGNKYKEGVYDETEIISGYDKRTWMTIAELCKKNLKGISQALINTPKRGRPKEKIYPIHALKKEYIELYTKIEKHLLNNFNNYLVKRKLKGRDIYYIEDPSNLKEIVGSLKNILSDKYQNKLNELSTVFYQKLEKGYKLKDISFNSPQNIAKHIIAGVNGLDFIQLDNILNMHSAFNIK